MKLGGPVLFLAFKKTCYLLRQLRGEMSNDAPSLCPPCAQPGLQVHQAPAPHSGSPASLPGRTALPSPFAERRGGAPDCGPSGRGCSLAWPSGRMAREDAWRWGRVRGGPPLVVTPSFSGPCIWAAWGCAACEALFSDVARDDGLTLYCDFVHKDLFVTGCFCFIAHPPLFPELLCAF